MTYTIYHDSKTVRFSDEQTPQGENAIVLPVGGTISRAKILKYLELCNSVDIFSPQIESVYAAFVAEFEPVEACGGVVRDAEGRLLMILRRGMWDLPKGHLERGETLAQCALREVQEETGLSRLDIGREICSTRHFYSTYGRWELKTTHWFAMDYRGGEELVGQSEEDIVQVEWVDKTQIAEKMLGTFPTIRYVISQM